jgi:Ser/Thr protein kinase RdoA (MazF antagonist)
MAYRSTLVADKEVSRQTWTLNTLAHGVALRDVPGRNGRFTCRADDPACMRTQRLDTSVSGLTLTTHRAGELLFVIGHMMARGCYGRDSENRPVTARPKT